MTLYTRLDAIMIERLLADGLRQADLYASAFRLLDAANIAGYLIAGLLLPMFSRLLAAQESVQPLVRQGFQLLWVGSVALAAICWYHQESIMRSLYSDGSTYSGQIMGWLMLSFIPMSAAYVHGSLLTAGGKLGQMNILFVLATLLNGILNMILIPDQGALGAAKATFITQMVVFVAQVLLAVYKVPLAIDIRWLSRLIIYWILVFATTWIWHWTGWAGWFIQALAAGCCALGWAIALGLLDNTLLPMLKRVK
jgi:O-antigen/teichoic acid export membrane protein